MHRSHVWLPSLARSCHSCFEKTQSLQNAFLDWWVHIHALIKYDLFCHTMCDVCACVRMCFLSTFNSYWFYFQESSLVWPPSFCLNQRYDYLLLTITKWLWRLTTEIWKVTEEFIFIFESKMFIFCSPELSFASNDGGSGGHGQKNRIHFENEVLNHLCQLNEASNLTNGTASLNLWREILMIKKMKI